MSGSEDPKDSVMISLDLVNKTFLAIISLLNDNCMKFEFSF